MRGWVGFSRDEGVGGVDGGFGLAGAVVGVDDVEARLARFGGERVTRHERFVDPDGQRVVALQQRPVRALVDHRRVGHRPFAAVAGLAAASGPGAEGQ